MGTPGLIEPLLRPRAAAEKLGLPLSSVYVWLRAGHIKAQRIGGRWWISQPEIRRLLDLPEPKPRVEAGWHL